MTNNNAALGFADALALPFVDVVNGGKLLTTDLAVGADKKSLVHAVAPGSRAFATTGKVEMFWVHGEKFATEVSLGTKPVANPNSEISFEVSLDILVGSTGQMASVYYVYTPPGAGAAAQNIGKSPADLESNSFKVDVQLTPLYDIYVTGSCVYNENAHTSDLLTLTELNNSRDHKWSSVTRGGATHLAINDKGELYAWGSNYYQSCGTVGHPISTPTLCNFEGMGSQPKIVQATTGLTYSLALDTEGNLYGAGTHNWAPMGVPGGTAVYPSFNKIGEHKFKLIAASSCGVLDGFITYAISKSDSKLYRCGTSVGNVALNPSLVPVNKLTVVDDGTLSEHTWTDVVVNIFMAAAINDQQELYVWGHQGYGRLGDEKSVDTYIEPKKVEFNGEKIKIKKVVLGDYHVLALDTDGKVWGWGLNSGYSLAHSDPAVILPPTIIPIMSHKCVDIATDVNISAAVTDDGKLYAWGMNTSGAIGLGSTAFATVPTFIHFDEKIGGVVMGLSSMFALSSGKKS